MKNLSIMETKKIFGGGTNFTGALLSSIKACIKVVFEIGQSVGGAIRRISSNNLCKF